MSLTTSRVVPTKATTAQQFPLGQCHRDANRRRLHAVGRVEKVLGFLCACVFVLPFSIVFLWIGEIALSRGRIIVAYADTAGSRAEYWTWKQGRNTGET